MHRKFTLSEPRTGICACGCGGITPISPRTMSARGWFKGEHALFIPGHNRTRAPLEIRFWASVQQTDTCWLWTKFTNARGYGQIGIGSRKEGLALAHRVSWELAYGPIPDGLFVCHQCDNPPCVRPDHLFLGTNEDNMRDMREKGRHAPLKGRPRDWQGRLSPAAP